MEEKAVCREGGVGRQQAGTGRQVAWEGRGRVVAGTVCVVVCAGRGVVV